MLAGIVLFNPDIERLKANIESIYYQVGTLVLVDNCSKNILEIRNLIKSYSKCVLICNSENRGIAYALNQIVEEADKNGEKWCITLDQDSVCEGNLVAQYEKYSSLPNVAMLCCNIRDRNFEYDNGVIEADTEYKEVKTCITSGSAISVEAWKLVGGFDVVMFIDKVDTDMCYGLRESGYSIYQILFYGILHEIGVSTRKKNILGKEIVIFNHSTFRCYYIVRNHIYLARKHKKYMNTRKIYKAAYHRILIRFIFEDNKIEKFVAGIKGLIIGHTIKVNYRKTAVRSIEG